MAYSIKRVAKLESQVKSLYCQVKTIQEELENNYNRKEPVISIVDGNAAPPTEILGDRYIIEDQGNGAVHADWDGASYNSIVEFGTTVWAETIPIEGCIVLVTSESNDALFEDGAPPQWVLQTSGVTDHTLLTNIGVNTHAQIDTYIDEAEVITGNTITTGLIAGGAMTPNADTTKFDISDGVGLVVDAFTDYANPDVDLVTWTGLTAIVPTFIAGNNISFIAIDILGAVTQQATEFTSEQRRDLIVLGTLIHTNNVNITGSSDVTHEVTSGYLVDDLAVAIGDLNLQGNNYNPASNDLTVRKESGQSFKANSNRSISVKDPNFSTSPVIDPLTFLYTYNDGSSGVTVIGGQTDIDPDQYDDGSGVLQAVANNKWTNQWFYFFPSTGVVAFRYGEAIYNSKAEATAAALITNPSSIGTGLTTEFIRTVCSIKKGATDLSDDTEAVFSHTGKFGLTGGVGGGAGGTFQDLQDTYNNSITPEITTDSSRGAFSVKRGSTLDIDAVIEVLNGAGTQTFSISGNGDVVTNELTVASEKIILGAVSGIRTDWGGVNSFYIGGSGSASTTGANNLAWGDFAADALTTGQKNIAIGTSALSSSTAGTDIIAIGFQAVQTTTGLMTGGVFIGSGAGASATSAFQTTAVGYQVIMSAGAVSNGAFFGYGVGRNVQGAKNTAMGWEAMGIGAATSDNVAIGYRAFYKLTAAQGVAIGTSAFTNTTTGSNNVGVGHEVGKSNITGIYNALVGHRAGTVNNGSRNVLIGGLAGNGALTSGYCIGIGYDVDFSATNISNELNIGDSFYATRLYLSNTEFGINQPAPEGALDIVSTTGGLIVPRMTTAQKTGHTAINGEIVYDTDLTAFYFYENGAWVTK